MITTTTIEKAGLGGHQRPATPKSSTLTSYASARRPSSPRPQIPHRLLNRNRETPPHRQDPEEAPGIALGALLIYLTARDLPARELRTGWAIAQKWLAELVDARHCREGVA